MRLGESLKMQAAINITPLVDVVLVLLIIFMVMAPQMRKGPEVKAPRVKVAEVKVPQLKVPEVAHAAR